MLRRLSARVALGMGIFASLSARAATTMAQDRDPAAAQALFDSARELLKQGKLAEACAKFQESNRLDPALATQFQLANCYEQTGRIATAWAAFLQVASTSRATNQTAREEFARDRAAKLEARLPRLVINVPEPSKVPGLEIRRNGMLVGSAQWGTPVAVDPGEIELTVSAPGKRALHQVLRAEEGKTASYDLPLLAQEDGGAVPARVAASVGPTAQQPPASPAATSSASPKPAAPNRPMDDSTVPKRHRNTALVLGVAGAGVVGLGVGTVFAVMAKNKASDSKANCSSSDPNKCDAVGVRIRNEAIEKGNVATVASIAGGAALLGAGVIWLLSGSSDEKSSGGANVHASADVGAEHGTFYLQGSF